MKFSVAAVVAFAATVFARPEFTNTAFNVVEGQPFTLTWRNGKGSITIELLSGPDKDSLNPVRTLTTLPDGTASFTFTPSGLPSGNYAFRISDESGEPPNYTVLIPYTGTGTLSSTTSATRTSTRTSTSISTSISSTETETETETTTDTATKTTVTSTASSTGSASITTTLSTTTTSTSTTTSSSRSTSSSGPANTNNGQRFASSLALVLGTVAALVFFN